jgi:hypothetical protein
MPAADISPFSPAQVIQALSGWRLSPYGLVLFNLALWPGAAGAAMAALAAMAGTYQPC